MIWNYRRVYSICNGSTTYYPYIEAGKLQKLEANYCECWVRRILKDIYDNENFWSDLVLFLLPKPFGQIETHKEWIKRIRSLYYRPEDLVATSLPSRARVLIFYWFTPNKSPTPSLFCRRTHWLSLHSLLTLTQRHSHCGTIDTNIKWHIHKHLYRHRHNWYIHRHWQKWCTQRHRHRDIHRLKASVSSWCKSHCTAQCAFW